MSSNVKKKAVLIGKYGVGFLIFNLVLKGIWLSLIYLIIAFGFDVVSLFEYFGWDNIASFFQESPAGEIGIFGTFAEGPSLRGDTAAALTQLPLGGPGTL